MRFKPGVAASERARVRRDAGVRRVGADPIAGLERVGPVGGESDATAVRALERRDEVLYAEPDAVRHAALAADDPLFAAQWALPRIDAPAAWDRTTGSRDVLVAVIDSGVDLDHPDLAPNLVPGWDFVDDDAVPAAEDVHRHGTHVAGVIGARGGDGQGGAGVAWDVRLLPLRVLGPEGTGTVSDLIAALRRASESGARIVNLSLAGDQPSQAERDAIAAAPGVLFVAAAGNEGVDAPEYPCAYDLPNVLCVTASDFDDGLPAFANTGALSVDLAAPGVGIEGPDRDGGWSALSGTSLAAPQVSGAAALLLSVEPHARPEDLASALTTTADPLPAFAGRTVSGGRLDVAAALAAVRATTPPPAPAPSPPQPAATPEPATPVPAPAAPFAIAPAPAKLKVRRVEIRNGRLDVLARTTRLAQGIVDVVYRAHGRTLHFGAPIRSGTLSFVRRLPRAQRRGSGLVTLRWRGSARVRATEVRLRAGAQPARLRRGPIALRGGRLQADGLISSRAHGVVRLVLDTESGRVSFKVPIRHGRWATSTRVPAGSARDAYLSILFAGDLHARGGPMRGEQAGVQLSSP